MRSPFPGMDPYLEDPAFWPDFHAHFITHCCDYLTDALPDAYEAMVGECVNLVRLESEVVKLVYPDVALSRRTQAPHATTAQAGTAVLEPVTIPHEFLEEVRETRIEILHRPERSLVTVLEVLSPANKAADGFQEYRNKRKAILVQKLHLVELDLLVGGHRLPLLNPLPEGDYFALLSRVENRPNCQVYSWFVRQSLPAIPIPLRQPDADVNLDLQAVFTHTFEKRRYSRSLPYSRPPVAALPESDRAWAMETAQGRAPS